VRVGFGVGDGAVPELRVQVLLQRVIEGVREPRGGLLIGETAAVQALGGRRPLVRLGLRDDATVVPQELHEVVVRAAGTPSDKSINQWTRVLLWGGGGKKSLHDGLPLIRRRSRIAIHVVTIPSPRGERFLQAEKSFRGKNSKASAKPTKTRNLAIEVEPREEKRKATNAKGRTS
jgi:hypothetical protein